MESPPLTLDVFIGLSSPRGASLQPKIYHSLYHLNIINLTREVFRLCDRTGVKSSIIPLFTEVVTCCRSLGYYRPHYLLFCDSLTDHRGRELNVSGLIDRYSRLTLLQQELGASLGYKPKPA